MKQLVAHGSEPQCGYVRANHDYRVLAMETLYEGRKLECSQCGCVKIEPQSYQEPDMVSYRYWADTENMSVSI